MREGGEAARSAAESLYAAWRLDRARGAAESLEAFCAAHPALADAVRALHRNYQDVDRALGFDWSTADVADVGPTGPFEGFLARLRARQAAAGRYEEGSEIGQGGMGSVLAAVDLDLRRPVAKKVIRGHGAVEPNGGQPQAHILGRFIEEAQVTAQLTHPGVVPVHELGLDEQGRVYYTMDRVEGHTLRAVFDLARRGLEGWTIPRAVGVLERVCETLAYAHSRGVIHRDLKPDNVMVGAFGQVYVMDWGLAKIGVGPERAAPGEKTSADPAGPRPVTTERREISDSDAFAGLRTEVGTAAGTPGYMPPEQARGDLEALDARTDVFAIGALLHALLSGEPPYASELRARDEANRKGDREAAQQALRQLCRAMDAGTFTPLAELAPKAPPELVSIAARAMAPRPADRYSDAQALRSDLRAWLEGRVVAAHESGPWAELRKWVGRNKALALSLAGGVIAIVLGLVGMYAEKARGLGRVQDEQARTLAEQERTLRLSASRVHRVLVDEMDTLWPALPPTVPALEHWHARASQLVAGRDQHERDLEALRASAPRDAESAFARVEDAWQAEVLEPLIEDIGQLVPEFERVSERLAFARAVEDLTLSGPAARDRWAAASAAIAGSPHYGGLRLEPQLGLLPLRADPGSALWEFWHTLSGEEPQLDPATDRWRIEEATGVVLVLIPGDTYLLGTRDVPEGHLHSDDYKDADRSDVLNHTVALDPYFISKYELTQAQWHRVRGDNPSRHREGPETHPVDLVSWDEAMVTLGRLDLTLPTEAQWEAAARARADTRFYTGAFFETLVGHAVLFPDAKADYKLDVDAQGKPVEVYGRPWRDHSEPVGSCNPNPFGLHDVHGNVFEWCLDGFDRAAPPRPGDGLRLAPEDSLQRVLRGGGYKSPWPNARLTYRFAWEPQNAEGDVGLRPARGVR